MYRLLHLTIILTLVCCNLSHAGPPTGPRRNECNNALTAVLLQDINFGSFLANTGGTVNIATNGTRTATGGVVLASGTVAAGLYEVNSTLPGCEIYPVKIRLPNNTTLTEPLGSTMLAAGFISLPAIEFTIIPGTPQLVEVGADLTAAAGQVGGTYDTLAAYSLTFRH